MITLPIEIKLLITFVVTQGIKSIANLFKKDIGGKVSVCVAVAVGSIVFFIEGILTLVPEDKREVVSKGIAFIAMLLGSFGTHYTYKNI